VGHRSQASARTYVHARTAHVAEQQGRVLGVMLGEN